MDFKEKIKAHQQGEHDFAAELMKLAQSELCEKSYSVKSYDYEIVYFTHWKVERLLTDHVAEKFIAIHLRTIMEKHAKLAYHSLRGIRKNVDDIDDLDRLHSTLDRAGYCFDVDEFDKIDSTILEDMEAKLGYYEIDEFTIILNEFLPAIKKIKAEKKGLMNQIKPLINESLNEALELVNTARSDKEIVKFINTLVDRKTYPKLNKLLGTKVHRINGEKYYVTKDQMNFTAVDIDSLLMVEESQLTEKQKLFYHSLKDAIDIELRNCNEHPFVFDNKGIIISINKRYFADQLKFEESAFKKRLIRLQEKKKKSKVHERRIII